MKPLIALSVLLLGGQVAAQTTQPADRHVHVTVIDDMGYPTTAAAQAAWQPMAGSAAVSLTTVDGQRALVMPCHFKDTKSERASWDKTVRLDLTEAQGLQFQMQCLNASPIAHFTLYLRSGQGWYVASFSPASDQGWSTITVNKADTTIEGTPAGWSQIDTLRVSAWRGSNVDTALQLRELACITPATPASIVLVRGESAAQQAREEIQSVCECTTAVSAKLEELGLDYCLLSDLDLTPSRLQGRTLVILPHNPTMAATPVRNLVEFLHSGGKMIAFYLLPPGLQESAGINGGEHLRPKEPGQFAFIRPAKDGPLADLPISVSQVSWNITNAKPVKGRSQVAAEWFDSLERPTGLPAIVASDNCALMTHVLLPEDSANKRRLLLAMAGYLVPALWSKTARNSLEQIGHLGPFHNLDDAIRKTTDLFAPGHQVHQVLREATTLQKQALTAYQTGRYPRVMDLSEQANHLVQAAACRMQTPQSGEHRAFWCHNAFGVEGMDWDQAIQTLADNGFTAILTNQAWGGAAYYESAVLPVAPEIKARGDQLARCLAACRKYGLACHIWKVNWNMGDRAPRAFAQRMQAQGRTQVDRQGRPLSQWLCPSHPENQDLEIAAMVEIATKYAVDGIHFDYIRYPDAEACFCAGCRERFEKILGAKIRNWPGDLKENEQLTSRWLDFRRDNITRVVAEVSARARPIRPGLKISAAVFANWPVDRDAVGQDWKLWCEKGYLDFVCPMDYTPSTAAFQSLVERQTKWAGKVPCYPGIGLSCWSAKGDIFTLFDQIKVTRQAHTGGFTIFNYDGPAARDTVPLCGQGVTRKQ